MQFVRSFVQVQRSAVFQICASQTAKVTCDPVALSGPVNNKSLRWASNFSNKVTTRKSQAKRNSIMADVRQFLRAGAHNVAGGAPIDLEVFGKAASGTGSPSKERGDCPFSQRIYLDLEEKNLPYKATYIQEGDDKPDWFLEKNPSGLMPALRDGEVWIQDSDKIAEHLEEKFPEHSLKTPPEYKNIGLQIFPAFTSWLKAKNPDDTEAKENLLTELKTFEKHLKANGPFIGGENPTDSDFALIPKLKHLQVALRYFYGFDIPYEYLTTYKYIELLEGRPSFKKTDVSDDMILQGWGKKFGIQSSLQAQA